MADSTISALTALTGANVDAAADLLEIVDTSVSTNKKIVVNELGKALNVLSAEQATTSGTSVDFTIPAGVKRIDIVFVGVSTNGSSLVQVQLGDSGGIETNAYNGGVAGTTSAAVSGAVAYGTGFLLEGSGASTNVRHGVMRLVLQNSSGFMWGCMSNIFDTNSTIARYGGGTKALSAELTTVRLTTVNGTDTFDAGAVSVQYGW